MAEAADEDISSSKFRTSDIQEDLSQKNSETARLFRSLWSNITDDNALTLYGFRRFRTTHLLNLRLLETEIDKIDHKIYQAGLSLDLPSTSADKLGLKHSKRDVHAPSPEEVLDPELVSKLRQLLKEYGMLLGCISRYKSFSTYSKFHLRRRVSLIQSDHDDGDLCFGGQQLAS